MSDPALPPTTASGKAHGIVRKRGPHVAGTRSVWTPIGTISPVLRETAVNPPFGEKGRQRRRRKHRYVRLSRLSEIGMPGLSRDLRPDLHCSRPVEGQADLLGEL